MKNLLIWVNPKRTFEGESGILVKIQINNSLDLGWKREDIILATNFDFEYNGVKSIVVSDDCYVKYCRRGSKHTTILELINRGVVSREDLYWFHDLDAFQLETITESELEMGNRDFALSEYCWRKQWSTGSIFFKSNAHDIFEKLIQNMGLFQYDNDEHAFRILKEGITNEDRNRWKRLYNTENIENIPVIKYIDSRVKKINPTYNFAPYKYLQQCYPDVFKPIRILHFFPTPDSLRFYMYGENEINTVLMPERLIKVFHYHGIK